MLCFLSTTGEKFLPREGLLKFSSSENIPVSKLVVPSGVIEGELSSASSFAAFSLDCNLLINRFSFFNGSVEKKDQDYIPEEKHNNYSNNVIDVLRLTYHQQCLRHL